MAAKGLTLYEQKHAFTFVVSEDSDGAGYLSRDTFVAEGGANGVDFPGGEIFAVVDGKVTKVNPAVADGSEKFTGIAGYAERRRNFVGQHFWARGYFVSTVGRDEQVIREYIRNQELEDARLEQLNLWR